MKRGLILRNKREKKNSKLFKKKINQISSFFIKSQKSEINSRRSFKMLLDGNIPLIKKRKSTRNQSFFKYFSDEISDNDENMNVTAITYKKSRYLKDNLSENLNNKSYFLDDLNQEEEDDYQIKLYPSEEKIQRKSIFP